jgi:mannitol 2-dehydrogenase
MKLKRQNLPQLPAHIVRPTYTLNDVSVGIAHIGVGGFHRAHQAAYTDALMNAGEGLDWGICGIGTRADELTMRDALASQDYLYTLMELDDRPDTEVRVIGSIRDMLLATEDGSEAVVARLADPAIRIVSLTITEGGYCMDESTGQFNAALPHIQHDLTNPHAPITVFGLLYAALARRRHEGSGPLTVMSCDNLPHNGDVTRNATLAFANLIDAELAGWIERNVSFPNAMVDRITPMTSVAHRQALKQQHGVDDAWPVVCEPFVQWVLEDKFVAGRPTWEKVGVQFTDDVAPYEEMKIKLLNGSHLALTYLGVLRGYRYVHETMADPLFVEYIRRYMDDDVTPQLAPVPGIDLTQYKQTLIERFSNCAISDQLERVCSDGSSKFSKFTVPTINRLLAENAELDRVALVVAAWALYLKGIDENGDRYRIVDPRADFCQSLVEEEEGLAERLLGREEIFGSQISRSLAFRDAFERNLLRLRTLGVSGTLDLLLTR